MTRLLNVNYDSFYRILPVMKVTILDNLLEPKRILENEVNKVESPNQIKSKLDELMNLSRNILCHAKLLAGLTSTIKRASAI